MGFDQSSHVVRDRLGRCLESRQANALFIRVEDAQGAIVSAYQRQRALQHCRGYFAKVRARVQCVGDLQQRSSGLSFAFLIGIDSGVLVTDRQLGGD